MEEDVLNALQTRSAYLSGGFDRQKRIIFVVNAFHDLQLWNRRYLQVTLDYLKRSLSASVLQNGVSVVVNAQESSSRISRQQVRQIYALFGGDINVDLYLVRAEGFWEKHVEPCAKSQVKGEPLVLSKARLSKFIEPQNLPEELGGTLQFNYDLWLQQRKSIDEFIKAHVWTLAAMEKLLALLREHKSLRPTEADVELKKCAQLHARVQNDIESAIDMGNAILARFNEVYETHSAPPQAVAPVSPPESPPQLASNSGATSASSATTPQKPLLPPDLVCERARIELRLNEIEKKQTAIRTAWLELLRSLREARELATLEEGVAFVTNWILQQAEQLLSRQRSVGQDVRGCEALRSAHDQLELECRDTYGCYAELLYKVQRFAGEREGSAKDQDSCQDLLSQRDFMQFVCRSFAKRLERRRNVLMTALRFQRLLEQFEQLLVTGNHVVEVDSRSLDWPEAEQLLMQLKNNHQMLGNVERELVREGEKLSDMLAMPVKDALGRDLQLDYSLDIAQLRRQIDASRRRRQLCGQRLALQRLTLEQVTHIHAYEEDARRARDWLRELYAVLLRCHSHVGCNIHEIQLQKDELQGFEETGRSIYHYGCQLLEASQTLRLCCKLERSHSDPTPIGDQLQHTWHSLQSIAQEQMTRLRVSAVFHRSVEAYYRQLRELRPLLTQELAAQLHRHQRHQHNRSSSGISSDAEGETESELSPLGEMPPRLQRHLLAREQLLVEVGRMVRLGRLLKKRLKEPFVLDALTGKSVVADELPLDCSPSPLLHDSGRTSSASGSEAPVEAPLPATVQVIPTGSNELACAAISHKLGAIAEVAESLDAVIRDVQQQEGTAGNGITSGSAGHGIKKLGSIEDWQSRSTEDESFATASEGNFTPNSHSSSFQTASGRTSSYIGSAKNSFDEADDSTLSTFEIPELPPSPVNMSFDSSDLSYFSAHQQAMKSRDHDQDSVAGVAELHSQSVTPTPDEEQQQEHLLLPLPLPQAIESDSEVEGFSLATGITTETTPRMSNAHTPESPEKIYIKVVELEPKITALGDNLDESLRMQREHDETLRNLQSLPGPMDEFVQKADKLLASKRISSELVNAMADTLNIIWQDILNLLQDRQHILILCTQFHDKMTQCFRKMDQLELACEETLQPIDVPRVQEFLNRFKQLRIDMLTGVMAALKDGNELLAQLEELEKLETLDTRPEHIKRDATRAVHQVQQWLEALHDRRNDLELAWQTRKTQMEQCLALALLGRELVDLEAALQKARIELNTMYSLGECEHTANEMLAKYRDWKQQALLLRDRALKITRAKEKVQSAGHFTSDEACARAYAVLSGCTEHLDLVDQREHWLHQSREFFAKAEHTLSVLEKLELELASVKLPPNSPESYAMFSKVERDVRNFTEEPIRIGYGILDEVGRTQPETHGVKRVLDELEIRKAYIEGICAHSSEDQQKVQRALSEFLTQHNELLAWLRASGQLHLQQSVDMGRNLQQAKQFLLQHHELMQDLEIKGELINMLLESIKVHLESLSPQQRYDVDSKAESLHKHWIELKDLVLKRVDYVSLLIDFFELANELSSQLDNLQRQLQQTPSDEHKLQFLQATWTGIAATFNELKSRGQRFINLKIVDPYLETKSSAQAVQETLNGFSKRQVDVTSSLENWTTSIEEKRQVEYLLEKVMSDNEETVAKSTQVDTQLYPVFTSASVDAKQLLVSTREKLSHVSQDIERAQDEIQQRIQTTLSIQTKDQPSLAKIEQVINNLRMLKAKLDGIKYDYRTLVESILQFLENTVQLRREIDEYFARQQQLQQQQQQPSSGADRSIAEHEKFRDQCMDKFRSLITQSELLIDRVRVLEPPGAREIDTDRILKLLENLRLHFESNSSARMSTLERLEKIEQFRGDLEDIDRSLDSVSQQLHEINNQSVDSLAAAKTTSLAFEYFERTIELLEKRIEKFTESTSQQLLISNPESERYVKDELRKLNDKWQSFKDQVKQKRKSLNQATEFFEVVEKIDAEYREISYFYSSVSNKVPYLRDPVEAANLVNDIEKYVTSREAALRSKLDSASQCAHDMGKVSTLYNDVMNIFQSFIKLKMDINVVAERLKQEQRQKEQRERDARDQAEREKAQREAEAKERLFREEQTRLESQRQQAAIEQAQRELAARELALREQAVREEEARLKAIREQASREQLAREQAAREEELRIQTLREIAKREEEVRMQSKREEETRIRREEEERIRRDNEARSKREEEARIQREEITRLQTLRDQVDQQRIVTENIRKDIQVNSVFTELRYASPLFVRPLKDGVTREGDRFTFECEVTGTPEPTVEWFKDGISIQNNSDYKTTFDKGICRLVIEETFAADSARFSCRASNLVGTCDTNATLCVRENAAEVQLVPPRILRFLESGKATEGSSFQFACVVAGVPLPTVQWFKNDKCIDDSPDYVISYNNGEATLRFEEVFLEDDAVYTCSASNPAGIEHCSASLIVEPLEPTELPSFKVPLSNAMARVGQKIKLEAIVSGIPRPEIYWVHNGKPFQPRDSKYEYGRVTLLIPQAYPNDAGSYVLSAKNLAGEAYTSCNVIVKGRLPNETSDSEMASDIEPIKPAVHLPLKDVSIFEGKPVRLDCVIVGQPEPEVIWYHNERPVKESADVQLLFQGDRCSLIIQEVYQEDAGHYKVVAINSAGETSSSCELKVTPLNQAEPATRAQAERQSLPKDTQPKFERLLSDVLADEGEQVILEVQASGDQPLTAQWYLTNKEVQLDDRVTTKADSESGVFRLILNNVGADDKGVYTVKVSNRAGDAKCFSHLIVKSVNAPENRRSSQSSVEIVDRHQCPEFRELFSDKQGQIDDVIKFECIVKGKPTPKVHWFFNDQPVHGHNFLVSTSGDRQVLTIQKLTHDAVGKISCVAENEAGKATCVAFLNIIGSGLPASSDVQTMTQEHNTESSRVTIKKQTFTTTSTSQVNSYEGNAPQTEVHHSSAHIDQSLKQLGQQRPEIVESHHYQELHKSKEMSSPSVQQKSFTLVQSSAPNGQSTAVAIPDSPTRLRREIAPRFTTPLSGKIVDQGSDVSMEAIYDGYPSPEIKVEKNGGQLFDDAHTRISNKCNRVTIELKQVGVADAGRYAVTASNAVGQSTSTADLVVKKTIFPPVFGRRLQAQVSKKGEKLVMEVEVTGLPDPTVTWLKDDKPLKDAGISQHRLLAQGNSYRLIIEKAQPSDSGKYMVRATNAGGEAKSIADCAILEPSPERMQEVVKTIVYETGPVQIPSSDFKTEIPIPTQTQTPQSYESSQTDATTANDLHGLSESKVITEHRCTTEATMRLEHKSNYLDLPELTSRPKTPTTNDTLTAGQDQPDQSPPTTKAPPPAVPPKPCPPVVATTFGQQQQPPQMQSLTNTRYEQSEHKSSTSSSSFDYFKKIDEETVTQRPKPLAFKPLETVVRQPQAQTLAEELRSLNLIPGDAPEFCYSPKPERTEPKVPLINEKIKILSEVQPREPPPQGGVPVFPPPLGLQTVQHETTTTKEVKVEYGQPIVRPAAVLATPAQQNPRSPSPKPSAEGVAMSRLWTPSGVTGYSSDVEHKTEKTVISTLPTPTPTKELNAPFLVNQIVKSIPPPTTAAPVTHVVNVQLEPGTPPEICFAPKVEETTRRRSLVESMEQKLEQNLIQGPSKVLPHSVPTLTPSSAPPPQTKPLLSSSTYRPPPPVLPNRLGLYESDYESDRYKYSGSESDVEPGSRNHPQQQATTETSSFKSSGYTADTEEHSSYRKSETSFYETKSSSSMGNAPTQSAQIPKLQPEPPATVYFTPKPQQQQVPPQVSPQANFTSQEAKDYNYTSSSMTSNYSHNMQSSSSRHETKFSSTTAGAGGSPPVVTYPSPIPAQRKTPAAEFSDYSSEIDERFRSVSRANESDAEIKGYRVVFPPTPTPRTNIAAAGPANGHKSPVVVITPSPMEFEPTPPEMGSSYARPKFEPIGREIRHEIKRESSSKQSQFTQSQQQSQQQPVYKPKPVAAKFIAATQQQQQPQANARPTMYYNAVAGAPMHLAKVATETKNVMQMHESTESSQRVVNMQQTKRVIHFDGPQEQRDQQIVLEPFPYSPATSRTPSRQSHLPPPATPTKFVPGEFRESDYESEVEGARIQPLWSPYGDGLTKGYRRVAPPQGAGRSCSLPRTYERVLSPMEFDRGPEMPSKIHVDINTLRKEQRGGSTVTTQHRTQSLNRNATMRQQQQQQQQQQSMDQIDRAGTLPRYGYSSLQQQAENQGRRMGSTFLQKSHQFVEDVSRDVRSGQASNGIRPGFKRAPSEGSNQQPQAFRDESRVSQYGTKCVDPNTGLIYFKYDFGYEFGILFPGEGHKFVSSQWNSNSNGTKPIQNGRHSPYPLKLAPGNELVIPVQHERSSHGYSSDNEVQRRSQAARNWSSGRPMAPRSASVHQQQKRYSLPSCHSLDIHLDRLHAQAPRLPPPDQMVRTVPELPNTEPVNAHLNRDELAQRQPLFITPLKDIAVGVGGTARFECIVQAHPQPQVNWTHNGGHLESGSRHCIEYRNGVCRLTLPQAYPDDNGSYACTAMNPLGAASTSGNLNVSSTNRGFRY